ncbi:MAG TPA: MFS transporter [Pseudolabrys sp.]|nr:MFS transporter [Pseudolabrys sp.]
MSATRWPLIFIMIGAGVVCAFQVGKAAIAVPLLRQDLGLSLSFAAWIVSVYAVLGAAAGLMIGVVVTRIGARRTSIVGLLVVGLASCAGAAATSGEWLIVCRIIEGCGFVPAVIAIPTLLRLISSPKDHDMTMALWSCYVPVGMVIIMFAGPWLASESWRMLWFVNGALAIAYAAVLFFVAPQDKPAGAAARIDRLDIRAGIGEVLRARGPMLLALSFGLYTFHYHAVVGLMPTLLIDRLGMSIEAAAALVALVIAINGVGNFIVGPLLRFGLPVWLPIAVSFVATGTMSFGIFSSAAPALLVVVCACIGLGVSGMVPGAMFAGAPYYTPRPALLAAIFGVLAQASAIGQMLGPAALGTWADHFGWSSAPTMFATVGIVGFAAALALRRTPMTTRPVLRRA